jgi:hypothetical protein
MIEKLKPCKDRSLVNEESNEHDKSGRLKKRPERPKFNGLQPQASGTTIPILHTPVIVSTADLVQFLDHLKSGPGAMIWEGLQFPMF